MIISSGVTSDGIILDYNATVLSGGTANNTAVISGGNMLVSGIANNTTIYHDASVTIFSGGTANSTLIKEAGSMTVSSGGTANNTTIYRTSALLKIINGGIASNTLIDSDGSMTIFSGGKADDLNINFGGRLYISSGGTANKASINEAYGFILVSSGGTANSATIKELGSMFVSSGGFANATTLLGRGHLIIENGGTAVQTIVKPGGWLVISSGANVMNTTVYSNAILQIFSGGTATGINAVSGALFEMTCAANTYVSGTSGGSAFEIRNGGISGFTLRNGFLYVQDSGTANDITVCSSGSFVVTKEKAVNVEIQSGGRFELTEGITSGVSIGSGGVFSAKQSIVFDVEIYESSGFLAVTDCSTLTGILNFCSGSIVSLSTDSKLLFDISTLTPDKSISLLNDFSLIRGTPDYSFTASDTQTSGNYILARGASSFNGVITVQTKEGDFIGIIGVGESLKTADASYSLSLEQGELAMDIRIAPKVFLSANNETPTQSASLTATTNSDGEIFFSIDNSLWTKYEQAIAVTDNITYYFKTTNSSGDTGTNRISFSNIDRIAPEKPVASADITTPTNGDVVVTAEFSDDSVKKEYLLDGQPWKTYSGGVTMITNGIVSFRGIDAAGNESIITTFEVNNIDKTPPEKPVASADVTVPTNGVVVVTAEFSDDSVKKEYSLNGKAWEDYSEDIKFEDNGSVSFRGTDAVGNESELTTIVVDNIDKVPPVITLAGDIETPLQESKLTASTEEGLEILYSTDNEKWTKYGGEISVTANGTYFFKTTDTAGNPGNAEITFNNIDTIAPVITLAGDIDTPLQASFLTASVDDGSEIFYTTDQCIENWTKYEDEIEVTANGTFYFKATDAAGNTGTAEIAFGNIDTIPPEKPVATADIVEITEQNVTVSAVFSEDSIIREYSLNGKTWMDYTGDVLMKTNGTVMFRGSDVAGNISEIVAYTVNNIQRNGPDDGTENGSIFDDSNNVKKSFAESFGTVIEEGTGAIPLDTDVAYTDENGELYSNFVGYGDAIDYAKINLEKAANLSFFLDASGAVKFTIYKLNEKTGKKPTLKSLQSTTLKKGGNDKPTKQILVEAGEYYISMQSTNVKKEDAAAFYNVRLNETGDKPSYFYTDGDNGENKYLYDKKQKDVWNANVLNADALVIDSSCLEEGKRAVQIDTDTETVVEHEGFTNYVGFGDAMDFRKIELKSAAKLSFDLTKTTGGAAKLIVYTVNDSGKMVVASSKLTVSVKAAKPSGILPNQVVLQKGVYYIAVQSTDAKKGKEAYYNVSLNAKSVFYVDGDNGANNLNSKTKKVDALVSAESATKTLVQGQALQIDGLLDGDSDVEYKDAEGNIYTNFVGSGDESDIVRIDAVAGTKVSLIVTATDTVSLVIYGLQKNKTLKALKTIKSNKDNIAELVDFELKEKSASGNQFYVGVNSINAKKGSAAYYNVDVVSVSDPNPAPLFTSEASALSMPETDSLGISDALSFGGYDVDVLADASASALAELDDKSGWLNIASLA